MGHIHISFPDATEKVCFDLMKCFDVFLTIPSLFMDEDDRRRELYGCAGEMRLCQWGTSRGFEARTLSNFWLQTEEHVEWVFNQLNRMFDYYNEHGIGEIDAMTDDIIKAINAPNRDLAGDICDKFGNLILLGKIDYAWI